eukprot:9309405-Pyramimonas_sp.AAC.1
MAEQYAYLRTRAPIYIYSRAPIGGLSARVVKQDREPAALQSSLAPSGHPEYRQASSPAQQ